MTSETAADISASLTELSFGQDIQRLTEDFQGREWVFSAIEKWLRESDLTFFILTGEAGVGKSAIAARLTQVRADIAAFNFCITGRNSTIVPGTVLRSIAAQLGRQLPDYGLALANTIKPIYLSVNVKIDIGTMNGGQITGVVINNLTLTDPKHEIESLLTAPLSAMPAPGQPVLILLDSLDEAFTYNANENLVTLLAGLSNLPPWVRIILTSRPEDRVLSYFSADLTHVVAAESQLNREDLRRYVATRVGKPTLSARLQAAAQPITPDALVQRVAGVGDDPGLASGNFLYAKVLLNDVESGAQPLNDLAVLPKSLDEIYRGFLLRLAPDWETRYQPLLAILAVAREPITRRQLLRFADQSARLIGGRMSATLVNLSVGVLRQFLDARGAPGSEQYSLFHQSLRDYLGETSRSGRFACPPEDAHKAIAEHYAPDIAAHHLDVYGLRHIITHLLGCSRTADATELLLDLGYLEEKCVGLDPYEILRDLDAVIGAAGIGEPKSTDLRAVRRFVMAEGVFLKRNPHSLFQQAVNQPAESTIHRLALTDRGEPHTRRSFFRWINKPADANSCLAVLVGHEKWVSNCEWRGATGRIVSADENGTIKLWDAARAQCLETYTRPGTTVLAWSHDGESYLADVGDSLIIADTQSGAARHRLDLVALGKSPDRRKWVGGAVACCAWSHDEGTVLWSDDGGAVHVWSVADGRARAIRRSDGVEVHCCSLSPDASRAVIGTNPPSIIELTKGRKLGSLGEARWVVEGPVHRWTVFRGHRQGVYACAWSPDGQSIATAGGHGFGLDDDDFSVRIWDASTLDEVACMIGHADRVVSCRWSSNGQLLVTISGSVMSPGPDNTIRLWDTSTHELLAAFTGHMNEVVNCAWSSDGTRILSASKDLTLRVWDATAKWQSETPAQLIAISPDGKTAATALVDHSIGIIELGSGKQQGRLVGHSDDLRTLSWASDSRRLASGAIDRTLRLWDAVTCRELVVCAGDKGETTYTAGGHRIEWGSVVNCAWSPDDARVVSASNDGRVSVWDPTDGSKQLTLVGHTAPVSACAWSLDGRCVISYGGSFEDFSDRSIRVWDALVGAELGTVSEDAAWALRDGIVRDSTRVGQVAWSRLVGQGSVPDLEESSTSFSLAYSSDGTKAAVWINLFGRHNPASIAVVDAANGSVRAELRGHRDSILRCEWCPNSLHLISASEDGTIRLWHTERGESLAVFPVRSAIRQLCVGSSGRRIVALDDGGHIYILELEGVVGGAPAALPAYRFRYSSKSWDSEAVIRCGACGMDSPVSHFRADLLSASSPGTPSAIPVYRCPLCGHENRIRGDAVDRRSQHKR